MGWMQPLFSQLLHVSLGEAEQPLSPLPAGLGGSENWQMRPVRRIDCLQMLIPPVHTPAQCPTWQWWLQILVQSLFSWTTGLYFLTCDRLREYSQLAVPMKDVELNQCGIITPNYMFHLWGASTVCHALTLLNCPVMYTSCICYFFCKK